MKESPFEEEESFTLGIRLSILGLGLLVCLGVSLAGLIANKTKLVPIYNRYFPTSTRTSTATQTLTTTPTVTATTTLTPTPNLTATQSVVRITSTALAFQSTVTQVANQWDKVLAETFDHNNQGWYEQTLDDEYSKITFEIKDGKYRWDAQAHKGFIQRIRMPARTVEDFFLAVDVNLVDHSGPSDYGVVFRADPAGNFYYFAIDSENMYSLYKYEGGQWSALIERTPAPAIQKEQPNQLAVLAEGDHMILFINGQFIAEKQDASIPKGGTGLAIEIFDPEQQAVLEFDNIVVRASK